MNTIFLQLLEDDYDFLVDMLCMAHNELMVSLLKEKNTDLIPEYEVSIKKAQDLLDMLGDQASSQRAPK